MLRRTCFVALLLPIAFVSRVKAQGPPPGYYSSVDTTSASTLR